MDFMHSSTVYFQPVSDIKPKTIAASAALLFTTLVKDEHITLMEQIPIKVHSGEPGNDTFIHPACYDGIIDYLETRHTHPYFIETNVAYGGARSTKQSHEDVARKHGFTRIPFVVADGDGSSHTEIPIPNGKHFRTCKIATALASQDQVVVMTHFKGHCMAGFGGAIKMLGIGFASARGKSEIHSVKHIPEGKQIDWSNARSADTINGWNPDVVYSGNPFWERIAESALAATAGKHYIYLTYAINLTPDCDCEGHHMEPVYPHLGVFASLDPVAIDMAVIDMLTKREGKIPFDGTDILPYAEKIGLGTRQYLLKTISA